MNKADYHYVLYTVSRHNVLPVTSACNLDCVFCSHKQNPPGIEVFKLPHFSLDEYRDIIEFLDPSRKIVIGESSTRIIEGEPFCRRDIIHVLEMVRERFTRTPLVITTNGCFLDEGIIQRLKELMPLVINLSINFATPCIRERMLGDRDKFSAVRALELLHKYLLPFNGSMVALAFPGWEEELEETLLLVEKAGARTFRIFYPGYTKYCGDAFLWMDYPELHDLVQRLREGCSIPVVLEPPYITDFQATVEGVIRDSPAFKAGITRGDRIYRVEGEEVASRVDAFKRILGASCSVIEVCRNGESFTACLDKEKGEPSGLVFSYDVDPGYMDEIIKAIIRYRSESPLVVTSGMAFPVIGRYFEGIREEYNLKIIKVTNNYFGGNIDCAGLMVVEDIMGSVTAEEDYRDRDLILLPSIAFDHKGRDLTGRSYREIEDVFGIRVEIL